MSTPIISAPSDGMNQARISLDTSVSPAAAATTRPSDDQATSAIVSSVPQRDRTRDPQARFWCWQASTSYGRRRSGGMS